MEVIGFFAGLFAQLGNLWAWVTTPMEVFSKLGIGEVSIIQLCSVGICGLLGAVLTLHIIHLVNVIAG